MTGQNPFANDEKVEITADIDLSLIHIKMCIRDRFTGMREIKDRNEKYEHYYL